MSTTSTEPTAHVRVWLVAGLGGAPAPTDLPTVRDNHMRYWTPDAHGRYHFGHHHATWHELRTRFDLVEVR